MRDSIELAARSFRLGAEGEGSGVLLGIIDGIATLLTEGKASPQVLMPVVQTLLEGQSRSDLIAIADTLEFELIPILDSL